MPPDLAAAVNREILSEPTGYVEFEGRILPRPRRQARRMSLRNVLVISGWGIGRMRQIGSTPYASRRSSVKVVIVGTGGELRLREICRRLTQNLVGLPQLAYLAFQRLYPVSDLGQETGTLVAVDLGLLDPFMQRLRNAADLFANRYHGRPSGRMIPLFIGNHPHRLFADLARKVVRRLACSDSAFSGVGDSDKSGAVYSRSARTKQNFRIHVRSRTLPFSPEVGMKVGVKP